MRLFLYLSFLLIYPANSFSQTTFSKRKGSKFFPGHLDVVVTVFDDSIRYELFNHWYSRSYEELRQISIPLNSLEVYNKENKDSLQIILKGNKVRITDEKYGLNGKLKHSPLCATADMMRKISYASKLASENKNIRHFDLYTTEELDLPEKEFRLLMEKRVKERINSK